MLAFTTYIKKPALTSLLLIIAAVTSFNSTSFASTIQSSEDADAADGAYERAEQAEDSASTNDSKSVFKSAITTTSTVLGTEYGSFGSAASISSKKYQKMDIGVVAKAATKSTKKCSRGTTDKKLSFGTTTCEPYDLKNWRQQGIAGVGGSGWADNSDIILTSWHNVDNTAARLTLMNKKTNKETFIELVRSCDNVNGYCELGNAQPCLRTHAAGLAWFKNTVFLANDNCLIAFNVNSIYKTTAGTYIMPATHFWKQTSKTLNYGALGIDVSGPKPQLLVSESNSVHADGNCDTTYIARWDLDPTTSTLALDTKNGGLASSDAVLTTPICYVQGLAYSKGMYFLSTFTNPGKDYLRRVRVIPSAPKDTKFLMPKNTPQGIYIDPLSGKTWGLTETQQSDKDGRCRVFNFKTKSMLG